MSKKKHYEYNDRYDHNNREDFYERREKKKAQQRLSNKERWQFRPGQFEADESDFGDEHVSY
jgi:hypothetical protein